MKWYIKLLDLEILESEVGRERERERVGILRV